MSLARERVAVWIKRQQEAGADKKAADFAADQESLDRAADLETIYADMVWVKEMPAPIKKKRGRRIDPKSREQFAKWVKQTYGWGSAGALGRLHHAHEVLPIICPAGQEIRPSGERSLRPLAKLRDQGYGDHQAEVWRDAIKIAELDDADTPLPRHVSRAVTEFLERHKPPIRNLAADPRSPAEKRADRITRLIAEFDSLLADEAKTAHTALTTMTQHYNALRAELRKSA